MIELLCTDYYEKATFIHYYLSNAVLDILTGADCKAYPRMKAYHENLPSDRYQWLLDVLAVLAEGGAFEATTEELKEITAQRDFELTRKPGAAVRRCGVEW